MDRVGWSEGEEGGGKGDKGVKGEGGILVAAVEAEK